METIADFRAHQAIRLAARCTNSLGRDLGIDAQVRLVKAIRHPSRETWLAARTVLVRPGLNLGAVVERHVGRSDEIPDPDTILRALVQALN